MKTIFSLNARDNVMWEVIRDHFNLSPKQMNQELGQAFTTLTEELLQKGVKYADLKPALIPSLDKMEIALVFDTSKIDDGWYGNAIFEKVLPLFNKKSTHNVLSGDLIDTTGNFQNMLYEIFSTELISNDSREVDYKHSSQFCLVYINNLSDAMVKQFIDGLKDFEPFIGIFDVTFASPLKHYLSGTLTHCFLKHKDIVLQSHPDDVDNEENENTVGYEFEEHGFKVLSLQGMFFDPFLDYKIERPTSKVDESDFEISLNLISTEKLCLKDLDVLVKEEKIKYLLEHKSGSLKKAGLLTLSKDEFEKKIRERLSSNYIFNMVHDENKDFTIKKFNVVLEFDGLERSSKVKILCAFAVEASKKQLRLITLY